jgi:hypothetical protein
MSVRMKSMALCRLQLCRAAHAPGTTQRVKIKCVAVGACVTFVSALFGKGAGRGRVPASQWDSARY